MCGLEPDDSSGDARQLSSSLITSALPRGYCCLFRIHATKPLFIHDYLGLNSRVAKVILILAFRKYSIINLQFASMSFMLVLWVRQWRSYGG
jgi:hypothetical protein